MKKNLKIAAALGVVAVVAVGGTFAYYTAQQTFENPFSTTDYSTSAVEKFNPAESNKWEPGATVDKKVTAKNTGEGDVWVRVKFDEAWTRDGKPLRVNKETGVWKAADGLDVFNVKPGTDGKKPEAGVHQVDTAGGSSTGATDGYVLGDTGTVVYKNLKNYSTSSTEAYAEDNAWYYNKDDGYFYYKKTLKSGESTDTLLDGVTLCSDADMGKYNNGVYYMIRKDDPRSEEDDDAPAFDSGNVVEDEDKYNSDGKLKEDKWIKGDLPVELLQSATSSDADSNPYAGYNVFTYKENILDDELLGYAKADYELNITVEFIQTTEKDEELAVNWGWTPNELIHD